MLENIGISSGPDTAVTAVIAAIPKYAHQEIETETADDFARAVRIKLKNQGEIKLIDDCREQNIGGHDQLRH